MILLPLMQAKAFLVDDPEVGVVEVSLSNVLTGPGSPSDRETEVIVQSLLKSALMLEVSAVVCTCTLSHVTAARNSPVTPAVCRIPGVKLRGECRCLIYRTKKWKGGGARYPLLYATQSSATRDNCVAVIAFARSRNSRVAKYPL